VLTHNFTGGLLPVKQQKTVTFNFYPTEPIAYRETVTFEINGLTQQCVEIRGKGAELKVASELSLIYHKEKLIQSAPAPTNNILVTYGALQVLYCIVLYCIVAQNKPDYLLLLSTFCISTTKHVRIIMYQKH